MKIKHISVVFILILAVMLTACGGKTNTPAPTVTTSRTEGNGNSDNNNGVFDPNNIGINNGNNDNSWTFDPNNIGVGDSNNNNSNNVDMTGHEPQGSGNFQDYWQGESYFDLVAYLEGNGYKFVRGYDIDDNQVKDGNGTIVHYGCYDANFIWRIEIDSSVISVRYVGGDPSNPIGSPFYIGFADNTNNPSITIDKYGMTMYSKAIDELVIVVQNIDSDASNMDPFRNTGFIRIEDKSK